jgi:hypothetical protein
MAMKKKRQKRGPKPDKLQIDGDWQEALKKAVKKKKPENGWPEEEKEQKSE